MSPKESTTKVKRKNAKEYEDEAVIHLDEQIEAIERRLAPYAELINTKNKLIAARRALLGQNRATGGTGAKLTLEEILDQLEKNPGQTASQLAEHFGVKLTTVSSHVYRNPMRFVKKDGRFWKRDPGAGMDTPEDVEDDE